MSEACYMEHNYEPIYDSRSTITPEFLKALDTIVNGDIPWKREIIDDLFEELKEKTYVCSVCSQCGDVTKRPSSFE